MPGELHIRWPLQEVKSSLREPDGPPLVEQVGVPASDQLLANICMSLENALRGHDRKLLLQHGARLLSLLGDTAEDLERMAAGASGEALTLFLSEAILGVPWELCPIRNRLLGEIFNIGRFVYATEKRSSPRNNRRATPSLLRPPVHVLFVADTSLEGASDECAQLREALRSTNGRFETALISDPTPEDLLDHLRSGDYQILHYAGHGKDDEHDPVNNGWLLAGQLLNEEAIRTAGVDHWPRFVFANACASSPLRPERAHQLGIDSIAVSLVRHGVRHYVSTLTEIPDKSVALLAASFYEKLGSGASVGSALAAARAAVGDGSAPGSVVAAHYVLYGNPTEALVESTVAAAPVQRPQSRGPYTLISRASDDYYQTVYRARRSDGRDEIEVQLSIPHQQRASQEQGFRDLQTKLSGAGLVPILDVGSWEGELDKELCVVRPAVAGTPLDVKKRREVAEACGIALEIARVLGSAHDKGVVHGALSPTDIIVSTDNQIWIQGLGQVEVLSRAGLSVVLDEQQQRYRSPEQWTAAARISLPRADLWALAVMTYEMLVGHHPFASAREQFDGWAEAVLRGRADPASLHRDDVPPDLERFLQRALASQEKDRAFGADDFIHALDRAATGRTRIGGFTPDLEIALETDAALFSVETDDEPETVGRLARIARQQGFEFFVWSVTGGLRSRPEEASGEHRWDPLAAVQWLEQRTVATMLVLLDGDAFLDDWQLGTDPVHPYMEVSQAAAPNDPRSIDSAVPAYWERRNADLRSRAYPKAEIRKAVLDFANQSNGNKLVVTSRSFNLPQDLAKAFRTFVSGPYELSELERVLAEENVPAEPWVETFMLHAAGFTATAIRRSLRLSRSRLGQLGPEAIDDLKRQKEQEVRRSGLLELWHPTVTLSADVVGADNLKTWFGIRSMSLAAPFLRGAMPTPRGLALGGLPGTGKSLCAQAIAGELHWPLLRLDMGRIFTSLLGAAESNMHAALALAERMSPAVLWIDDLDASFGNAGDAAGVGGRVLNTFLTWLQERESFVLLVATLRHPATAPAELLRSGRFDAVFYLDTPNADEREGIIAYHLRKRERSATGLQLDELARAADGLTGAEIATSVDDAIFEAAARGQRSQPNAAELQQALTQVPRSDQRRAQFHSMRQSWKTMALPA